MSAIQDLVNRCEYDSRTLGMANLQQQAEQAAAELTAMGAELARLREFYSNIAESKHLGDFAVAGWVRDCLADYEKEAAK